MGIQTLDDLDPSGSTVGVRVDINSPLTPAGALADDARLRSHLDTLSELLEAGGRVGILAHQGRPGGSEFGRLETHADRLNELLPHPVDYTDATFSTDARDRLSELDDGEAVVLENTRFYSEEYMEFPPERAADTHLVSSLAPLFDAFVNDAFAAAHRSQPSLVGFPLVIDSYAGRVLERELDVLGDVPESPTPRVCVLAGSKVPDSLSMIRHVLEDGLVDTILTAGVVGNVFLSADGIELGEGSVAYLEEKGYVDEIERASALLDEFGDEAIRLPTDVAVERDGRRREVNVESLPVSERVCDVGAATIDEYTAVIERAGTVFLNGPAGVFEDRTFEMATRAIFRAVADAEYSIVGGGDTAAAIRRFGIEGFDHVSTGGGATLRMLTGEPLPAVEVLER